MPLNKGCVTYYTKAVGQFTVYFPENYTTCDYCPYCYIDRLKIAKCRITDEFLPYTSTGVGASCPLKIVEED